MSLPLSIAKESYGFEASGGLISEVTDHRSKTGRIGC